MKAIALQAIHQPNGGILCASPLVAPGWGLGRLWQVQTLRHG